MGTDRWLRCSACMAVARRRPRSRSRARRRAALSPRTADRREHRPRHDAGGGPDRGAARDRRHRAAEGAVPRPRGASLIENLLRDVRLAVAPVAQAARIHLTAIVSLALGIGANTAIFQLLNALSLRPLPVRAPHELVEMRLTGAGRAGRHTGRNRQISLPQYEELCSAPAGVLIVGRVRRHAIQPRADRRGPLRRRPVGVRKFLRDARRHAAIGRLIAPADDAPGCGSASR